MISDIELREIFREIVDSPDLLTGLNRSFNIKVRSYRIDSRIIKQINRGQAARFWEDAPKHGCAQCVVLFQDFDAINKYCFDCYKVLIEPRNIAELFKLLLVFERITSNNSRKCMIDERPYSNTPYKGFVYCRGLEEANTLCNVFRHAVSEHISPDIPVKVKRGCTEFGLKYPEYSDMSQDPNKFQYRKEWEFYENFVDQYYILMATLISTMKMGMEQTLSASYLLISSGCDMPQKRATSVI
jgi:hypothetical protein